MFLICPSPPMLLCMRQRPCNRGDRDEANVRRLTAVQVGRVQLTTSEAIQRCELCAPSQRRCAAVATQWHCGTQYPCQIEVYQGRVSVSVSPLSTKGAT